VHGATSPPRVGTGDKTVHDRIDDPDSRHPHATMTVSTSPRAIPEPTAGVWPGLYDPPHSPLLAAGARAVVRSAVHRLPLLMEFPDGTRWGRGGPRLRVLRPDAFFSRLGRDGLIGLGEAWMAGDVTAGDWVPRPPGEGTTAPPGEGATAPPGTGAAFPDGRTVAESTDELTAALTVLARHAATLVPSPLRSLRRAWQHRLPTAEEGTVHVARENAHRHYDLSNELFELMLDPTLCYSSAWFEPGDSFEQAQLRKIDGVLDLARVGAGTRLIEIGCGWGSLAIRAAQRGATVVGLTLSSQQQQLARRRVADAGVADRVQILLQDYRVHAAGHPGAYTAAASVEMIENVGEAFWPDYFRSVAGMLEPGARFGLQSITMSHDRLLATHRTYSWIGKYIFPGGRIPSVTAIQQNLAAHTSLRVLESRTLGRFYGPTLRRWRHAFADALPRVAELGFDETFLRMWTFYLAYSEAGFEAGYLDDYQLGIG